MLKFTMILTLLITSDIGKSQLCLPEGYSKKLNHYALSKNLLKLTQQIYLKRKCLPLWYQNKRLSTNGYSLSVFIGNSDTHGLDSQKILYHRLRTLYHNNTPQIVKDHLLTFAFIKIYHALNQKHPHNLQLEKKVLDLHQTLNHKKFLCDMLPGHRFYYRLHRGLKRYERLSQLTWHKIESKKQNGDYKKKIIHRLLLLGDMSAKDKDFSKAIKNFQERHGLYPDGKIGYKTLAAINIPFKKKVNIIKSNLRRWQQTKANLGGNDIIVNLAANELKIYRNRRIISKILVASGTPKTQTPLLSTNITHIQINPKWHIPENITRTTIIPRALKDLKYLKKNNIKIYDSWSKHASELPRTTKYLNLFIKKKKSWRFTQMPGGTNPLGSYKFSLQHGDGIFLHGTTNKSAFSRAERFLSHGCIRLADPTRLALFLLRTESKTTSKSIIKLVTTGKTFVRKLKKPYKIYTTYQTAWADENGTLYFRKDLYGLDKNYLGS